MGNGITNNIIDQVKRKLSENGTASTQPKSNSAEPSIQDMITKTVMESFSSGGDKKSTGSFNPQNLIDMATQLTLIRSLPKLLEGALGDSSDKQVSSPMLEQIMKRIDKMDERISQEAERQKQKELIESAIKPYKDQIDALMARSRKDEDSPKKNEEIMQVQTALAGLEKNINDTLLNVKKNEEAKQADALRTDIENIERAMESQYNNLFALVNSDRNRERSPANPMTGMREALKYLQEEKELMKQLGMIKENIDDGGDLKSTLDNLKDVTSRVPELVESGKTIYDMFKGTKSNDDDDEEIPPYENSEMNTAPILERKTVEVPSDLRVYLMRGEEIPDPVDNKKMIWVDEWGNGYNHPSSGRYMTKKEIEMQMKLKPDEIRRSMQQSKDYYETRVREDAKVKMAVDKDKVKTPPPEDNNKDENDEETGDFSPDEDDDNEE